MKSLPLLRMKKVEPVSMPTGNDAFVKKPQRENHKKIGSFMRRDKRKNTKSKEPSSENGIINGKNSN